ncbi:MAG: peptidoglycan DD-metalloendopeptidase family protein [Rikenellaceae bacterium]|nr:peptidoglycan DD-metalloendopeptidase family protein [Rikenellaceae bacterium]
MRRFAALILSIFLTTLLISQNVSEQTAKKQKIEEEIAYLDKQLATTKSKKQSNTKELNYIQRKISNRKKLLKEIENEIKNIDNEVSKKEQQIAELDRSLESLKRSYSELVYNAYKNRDQTVWLMYVLASKNIEQGYRRWSYIKDYTSALRKMADEIRGKSVRIAEEKYQLAKIKSNSLTNQAKKELEVKRLSTDESKARSVITQLSRKEKEMVQQLNVKRREVEKLNREIERILTAAVKEKERPDYKATAVDIALSEEFGNNRGKLPWPVKRGAIIEQFGQHNHPVFKSVKLPFNNGVSISTDAGAEVLCVFNGVVKQVLMMPGYNQCILVQHGDYFTFYTKLEKIYVKSGQKVKTGDVLGSLTVSDNESVIHFQLWKGTIKQNPENWIR